MILKERLSKLKLREKVNILKEDIKARPLKYVTPILFFIILDYPLKSYAEETIGLVDKTDKSSNSKLGKFRDLGISVIGLKKCLDPSATPLQKALSCSRPCCLIAGLTASYISENSAVGSKVYLAATACAAGSWSAYGALLIFDRKKQ